MRRNPTVADYHELASLQRGEPESAMHDCQEALGGGVLSWALEHCGDIIHRMSENLKYPGAGGAEKVEKVLRQLRHPYGFAKEAQENAISNARYHGIPFDSYAVRVASALDRYARAHEALPAYNEGHRLAKEACVALARGHFAKAEKALASLAKHTSSDEEWDRYVREGLDR